MSKKKPKIVLAKGALDRIPEEDREALMKTVTEAFADFDPENPPGKPVISIPPGTTVCPLCGGELTDAHSVDLPGEEGGKALFLDCEACDETFGSMAQ